MRIDGCTFQEIADKMGISKQYVHAELKRCLSRNSDCVLRKKCVYPNISKYILGNKLTISSFVSNIGMNYDSALKILKGISKPSQTSIEKILKATGMTYEEAFWREENETESDA